MKIYFILLILMAALFSCRSYKLSQSDLSWQPYIEGDTLVFESNKGVFDTVVIKSIEKHSNPDDYLAIFPNFTQTLFVIDKNAIITLKSYKHNSQIMFDLGLGKNHLMSPTTILELQNKSISKLKKVSYNDIMCYKIKAEQSISNLKHFPFDLNYIYWNKQYGYVGLEYKNNEIWKLKYMLRKNKNIFN